MKIFVGNLSFQSTEDSIRSVFSEHGSVDEVAVITDRETGRPRGFAFVTMPNDEEAQAAIDAVNGQSIDGRAVNVNEARERGGRGGGGGGGGGGGRW
jgi:RNA recognition motif-containing protein